MPQCQGKTRSGEQCKRIVNSTFCYQHVPKFIDEKPNDCFICCYPLNMKDPLSCGHWVHYECILKSGVKKCPFCREDVYIPGELVKHEPEPSDTENIYITIIQMMDNGSITLHDIMWLLYI